LAENKIAELEAKRDEEEEADKAAKEAAEKAVAAYELISSHEEWDNKISALSNAIETLKGVIDEYMRDAQTTPDTSTKATIEIFGRSIRERARRTETKETDSKAKLERAFAAANKALEDAEAFVQRVKGVEEKAVEAYEKLKDGDFKTRLAARLRAAKTKANEAAGKIEALKANMPKLQDVLDVKAAKTWLTADKFAFGSRYPADSERPRILPLAKHENQTTYKYVEVGRMDNGKFVKDEGRRDRGSAFVEIEKDNGGLRVNRGREDASVIVEIEISKGNTATYKYFKINIPEENSVTIEAL